MLDIKSFIRYAIPGYIVLAAVVLGCRNAGITSEAFNSLFSSSGAASAAFFIAGPLVGFIIQQLYFLYFDSLETYDTLRRPALRVLTKWSEGVIDRPEAERAKLAFITWKIVMTKSTDPAATLGVGYVRSLKELHSYVHSFGAIVLACITALVIGAASLLWTVPSLTKCVLFVGACLVLATIFGTKRRSLTRRADQFERAAILRDRALFLDTMRDLAAVEAAFAPGLLTTPGRNVASAVALIPDADVDSALGTLAECGAAEDGEGPAARGSSH